MNRTWADRSTAISEAFIERLRELRQEAGDPPFRQMACCGPASASTLQCCAAALSVPPSTVSAVGDDNGEAIVSTEALVTAWRAVQTLDGPPASTPESRAEVAAAVQVHGHTEIARASITLIAVLLQVLAPDGSLDARESGEDDALSLMFPPLMRQLRRRFPELAPDVLPILAGILTAALTDLDAAG